MKLRKIAPMKFYGIEPGGANTEEPKVVRAKPADLLVDETYQRNLSERSIVLIRRMIKDWSWRSFQPPLCVRVGDALHVVDGQHTAIAAASHPKVDTIPVLIVDAPEAADRASAFIGRNRDRIVVTTNQLHAAAVIAKDPTALAMHRACEAAGVRILKSPPGAAFFKPGDTMAVTTIKGLLGRRGENGARIVLKICARAKLAPVSASMIKAVEETLHTAPAPLPEAVELAVREGASEMEAEAKLFALREDVPHWKALAAILHRKCRSRRRAAA